MQFLVKAFSKQISFQSHHRQIKIKYKKEIYVTSFFNISCFYAVKLFIFTIYGKLIEQEKIEQEGGKSVRNPFFLFMVSLMVV